MNTRVAKCSFCGMNLEVPDYIALQEKLDKTINVLDRIGYGSDRYMNMENARKIAQEALKELGEGDEVQS